MSLEFSKQKFFIVYVVVSLVLFGLRLIVKNNNLFISILAFLGFFFFIGFFIYSGLKMKEQSFNFKSIAAFSAFTSGITSVVLSILLFFISKLYIQPHVHNVKLLPHNEYLMILLISLILGIIFEILISILLAYLGTKLYKSDTNKTDI